MWYRNLRGWVEDIATDPYLAPHMDWDAQRLSIYRGGWWVRCYDEPTTANAFWDTQVCSVVVILVVLKTQTSCRISYHPILKPNCLASLSMQTNHSSPRLALHKDILSLLAVPIFQLISVMVTVLVVGESLDGFLWYVSIFTGNF